jgi:osmotically-inducible protein OsmY
MTTRFLLLATLFVTMLAGISDADAQRTAGRHVDDTTLHSSTKIALADAAGVPASRLNVEVYSGAVQLSGFVETQEEKDAALNTAKQVEGAERVDDAIIVMPGDRSFGTSIDDNVALANVEALITKASGMGDALDVVTKVRKGEALLAGFVSNDEVRKTVVEAAESAKGVSKVHDRISLKK